MFKKISIDLLAPFLFLAFFPLFFFKLGQSSLVSFDEAWYADIARNILKNADPINLTWNGRAFIDHPPGGFWLTTLSYLVFGVSEFSARFSSAISGLLTLVFTYLLGKKLFNKAVGFCSAVALASSPWFLFRARSGNLDVPLTLFFVVTVYLAVKCSDNKKYLIPLSLSLAFLFLVKTAVPFTVLPVVLFILVTSKKVKIADIKKPFLIFVIFVCGWFLYKHLKQPGFLRHYFKIGLPGVSVKTSFADNLKLMKEYLHNGIGKWFWPGIASIILGTLTFQKRFWIFSILFLSFFTPFLLSEKGHIWQLVPLHPFLILALFGFFWFLLERITNLAMEIFNKVGKKYQSAYNLLNTLKIPAISICLLVISFYYSYIQGKRSWYEFIDIPAFISDEAILSKEAGKYYEDLYIDGDFLPTAIYYSEKVVKQIQNEELKGIFEKDEPFLVITYKWRLDRLEISEAEYEIIKSDRDKILVKKASTGSNP